jgi:predicted cation transporter
MLLPFPGAATFVGANLAVTPFGNPLIDIVIADLNPPSEAVEMPKALELPAVTVTPVALLASVNVGTATVNATLAARVKPPPLPLMMTVELFAVALLAAENVTVTGAVPLIVADDSLTVTPAGAPLALKVTTKPNPPCAVIDNVVVADTPGANEMLGTLGVSMKFNCVAALQ